jgi:hypothetical protein
MNVKGGGQDPSLELAGNRARREPWWARLAAITCAIVCPNCGCVRCRGARPDSGVPGSG